MYLWKCWRDTRYPFCVAAAAVLLAHLFYLSIIKDWFGWIAAQSLGLQRAHWEQAAEITVRTVQLVTMLGGLILGAEGLPREFSGQTVTFLLTRPRTRAFYLWTSWAVGAAQVVFIVALGWMLDAVRIPTATQPVLPFDGSRMLKHAFLFSIVALVLYSLTFCLGVLLRSDRRAIRAALGTLLAYSLLVSGAEMAGIQLPTFMGLMEKATSAIALPMYYAFPYALCMAWLGFALFLAVVADGSFRRYQA